MGLDVSNPAPLHVALVALGSNLGDREEAIRGAIRALERDGTWVVEAVSSLYASDPLDAAGGEFRNAVARVRTALSPGALLEAAKAAERAAGRTGTGHDARPLDIDLLYVDDSRTRGEALSLPHPRRWGRSFVVVPLAEVCGAMEDPETGRPIAAECAERAAAARPDLRKVAGPDWYRAG
jgi:2-amino-4-hydroxy-6-hydroxymethyldihydropteridine diphosphokinase